MPTNHSARLDLPYLAAGQLQKHVTLNEALTRLDTLTQTAVISRSLAAQPTDPDDGDLYILPVGATGPDWSGWADGDLVRAELGGWTRVPAPIGLLALVQDTRALVARATGGWVEVTPSTLQNLTRLGLNTTADATNPFAARVNKALWTAVPLGEGGDGDLRFTFNKDSAADVLSLLFQSGYGGRAELGLIGDDDLSLKVSDDGAAWHEALRIDGDVGRVWFPHGASRAETVQVTASGGYAPPDWARVVTVVALGGGGGGGPGASGPSGSRPGGGGGGAGGLSGATWRVEDLPGALSITIGAGGGSGASGGDTVVTSGGLPLLTARGGASGDSGPGGGGGLAGAGTGGGNPGGATSTTATASSGGSATCPAGPGGGGGGGGLDAGATPRAGGTGGAGGTLTCPGAGGSGGSGAAGSAGATPPSPVSAAGGGGGGGGAAASGAGHPGGAGGAHGAGGGGGGAGVSSGGAGGPGAGGVVLILVQG